MSRILAIEPDSERAKTLKRLVSEWVDAEVVVAASTNAAIASMAENRPDLILASALISPDDDAQLTEHLKQLPVGPYLPVLTVPPVVDADEVESDTQDRGLFSLFKRRQQMVTLAIRPAYDHGALAARIKEALEESQALKARAQVALEQLAKPVAPVGPSVLLDESAREARSARLEKADAQGDASQMMTHEEFLAHCGLGPKRLRAHRWMGADLTWLTGIKLPWGLDVRLLNISRTGMLIESGARFMPGSSTVFRLFGPNKEVSVPARIVRSRVAAVDSLGVKYHAAATFDRKLDALVTSAAPQNSSDLASAVLSDLLVRVKGEAVRGAEGSDVRTAFEKGVQEFVTAREIRIRDVPVVQDDGSDSIYFTVPTTDKSQAVLQATFEPDHSPRAEEFELLKAAATMAAEILQIEETFRSPLQAGRSA